VTWALLEAAAGATIDVPLEEPFTIQRAAAPPADPNGRKTPSGSPVPFSAVYSEPDVQRFPDARGHASSDAREFGAGKPRIDFPTASLPFRPVDTDLITRVATGVRYAISHVGGNGFTRTVLTLTAQS
jgi:hypothetical protein